MEFKDQNWAVQIYCLYMGLISPELLAQLTINSEEEKSLCMKKYELKSIDTARKKVLLSSIYMRKITSLMYFQNHSFYFVTVFDGEHENCKVSFVAEENEQFALHFGRGMTPESLESPKVGYCWVWKFVPKQCPLRLGPYILRSLQRKQGECRLFLMSAIYHTPLDLWVLSSGNTNVCQ